MAGKASVQNGKKGGRPKGSLNKVTLEKRAVLDAFNQRVMLQADALFNAQFSLAVGTQKVFRIDETEDDKGKVKREHVLVTDPDEIKALLDEHDGGNGEVDGSYYYITTAMPDNRAIDSMLNRTFGKPTEHTVVESQTPEQIAEQARQRLREVLAEYPNLTASERRELIRHTAKRTGVDEAELVM